MYNFFSTHANPPGFPCVHVRCPRRVRRRRRCTGRSSSPECVAPLLFLPSASGRPHISNTLLRRCAGGACIVIFQKKILYFIVWLARLCFACGRKKTRSQKIILYDLLYVGGAGLAPDHLLTFVYTQPILDALFVTRLWIEMPRLVDERVSRGVL